MFDYTDAMDRLFRHIAASCPEFKHIKPDQVIVSYIRSRSPGTHGVFASVQPLRFKDGERTITRRDKTYEMPPIFVKNKEILYITYFALPRFADLGFELKLTTVFHELYHINPKFNGDIRRLKGKYYAHGHSRKRYNERVKTLADKYLALPGAEEHTDFLRLTSKEIIKQHGGITGIRIRPPKLRKMSSE